MEGYTLISGNYRRPLAKPQAGNLVTSWTSVSIAGSSAPPSRMFLFAEQLSVSTTGQLFPAVNVNRCIVTMNDYDS